MGEGPKRRDRSARDEDEIDPDAAPEPEPFRVPKGLHKVAPEEGPVEVKSGAASPPEEPPRPRTVDPSPPPLGAVVRRDRPAEGPRPRVPTPEDFGAPRIRTEKGAPRLPRIEPPGRFDVVQGVAVPRPRPAPPLPSPLEGEVEVVDYRKTGPVDVSGQAPDPWSKRRRIGVVDTMFARVKMGDAAEDELRSLGGDLDVVRRTVPGVKDLAVECKLLVEKHGCDVVVACGMVGRAPVDKTCGHEASLGLQWARLLTNRHILEVFVHEDEAQDEKQLARLLERRTRAHARNAWWMLFEPERLRENAGRGIRQGFEDAGPIPHA